MTPDQYFEKAVEARRLAKVSDDGTAEPLIELAKEYKRLAAKYRRWGAAE